MYNKPYQDDPKIENSIDLWRRIHPDQIVFDENIGRKRPSSQAFGDSSDGTPMSVALSNIALSTGPVMAGYEGFVLAAFTAGFARALGQGVAPDPLPDDPAHGVVFGKKTHSTKLRFAKECLWVIEPNGG